MDERVFKPEIVKDLMAKAGISTDGLADAIGIPKTTLPNYLHTNRPVNPSLSLVVKIADFFAVPVDVLLGRTTKEQYEEVLSNYSANFLKMIKPGYEHSLVKRNKLNDYIFTPPPNNYIAPYPYNLLDTVFGYPVETYLTEDRELGLAEALNSLSEREKEILLLYFEEGYTLREIGEKYDRGSERIRQIIAKALRKLRHPSRARLIMYGLNGSKELSEWNRQYSEKLHELQVTTAQIEKQMKEMPKISKQHDDEPLLRDLGLSVRSFNSLARWFYINKKLKWENITINDISELILNRNKFLGVRNLGKKSAQEILVVLRDKYGFDFFDIYPELRPDKEVSYVS